jgi:hypothetical protein
VIEKRCARAGYTASGKAWGVIVERGELEEIETETPRTEHLGIGSGIGIVPPE